MVVPLIHAGQPFSLAMAAAKSAVQDLPVVRLFSHASSAVSSASFPLARLAWHFWMHAISLPAAFAAPASHFASAAGGIKPVSSPPNGVCALGIHVTWALSVVSPPRPLEHDGRLSMHWFNPAPGQKGGASTPSQEVQVPPLALQPPVRTQLLNPVKPVTVHAAPWVPARVIWPLGAFTVTLHAAPTDGCVMLPSSHDEMVVGLPPELLTEKLKVVRAQVGAPPQ
jgi:hypothetical protein